jgi:hypothetical protein
VTILPSRPRMIRTCTQTWITRQQQWQQYPTTKPPGTQSKYGKTATTWNIIYDPDKDKILTWTNQW